MKKKHVLAKIVLCILISIVIQKILLSYFSTRYLYVLQYKNILQLFHLALTIKTIDSTMDAFINREYSFYKMISMSDKNIFILLLKTVIDDSILLVVGYGLLISEESIVVYVIKMLIFVLFTIGISLFLYYEKYYRGIYYLKRILEFVLGALICSRGCILFWQQGIHFNVLQSVSEIKILSLFSNVYENWIWISLFGTVVSFNTINVLDNKCILNKPSIFSRMKLRMFSYNKKPKKTIVSNIYLKHALREMQIVFRNLSIKLSYAAIVIIGAISLCFRDYSTATIVLLLLTVISTMLMLYVYRTDTFNKTIYTQLAENYNSFIIKKIVTTVVLNSIFVIYMVLNSLLSIIRADFNVSNLFLFTLVYIWTVIYFNICYSGFYLIMDDKDSVRDGLVHLLFLIIFPIFIAAIFILLLIYSMGKKIWKKKILLEG